MGRVAITSTSVVRTTHSVKHLQVSRHIEGVNECGQEDRRVTRDVRQGALAFGGSRGTELEGRPALGTFVVLDPGFVPFGWMLVLGGLTQQSCFLLLLPLHRPLIAIRGYTGALGRGPAALTESPPHPSLSCSPSVLHLTGSPRAGGGAHTPRPDGHSPPIRPHLLAGHCLPSLHHTEPASHLHIHFLHPPVSFIQSHSHGPSAFPHTPAGTKYSPSSSFTDSIFAHLPTYRYLFLTPQ